MHYFNVGANRIYVYDSRNELPLTNDLRATFHLGKFDLLTKDIVAVFSRGLHMNMITRDRINIFDDGLDICDKAKAMVELVNKKDMVNQNNATTLLIEVVK